MTAARAVPRVSRWVAAAVLAFLTGKLATLLANLVLFPTVGRRTAGPVRPVRPGTALLVPVRDEAHRLAATLPGLLGSGVAEVVFLDDGSTDDTAGLIRRTAADLRAAGTLPAGTTVRVVTGAPRPPGWAGKTWACAQLADATDADVLVFCDADVELAPGALAVVLAEMGRQDADVFSVICRQRAGTWSERLLTPLITDVILCLFPFPLLRCAAPSAATAEGTLLVFRRAAYDGLGGFAAVRGEIVEDVAMARLTRRHGLRLGLVLGGDVVQTRMYTGYREIITGMGRGLAPVGRRPPVAGGRRCGCCTCWPTRRRSCSLRSRVEMGGCWVSRSGCWSRPRPGAGTGRRGAGGRRRRSRPCRWCPGRCAATDLERTAVRMSAVRPRRGCPASRPGRPGRPPVAVDRRLAGADRGGRRSRPVLAAALGTGHGRVHPGMEPFGAGRPGQFRSRGSLSQLSPYLSAGVVATTAPAHRGAVRR